MNRLIRFAHLSGDDRKLLVKTATLLCAVRIGLWILPFQTLRNLLSQRRSNSRANAPVDSPQIEKITRGVKVMSRYVPAATCLTQALVTVTLLEQAGRSAEMRIGVARSKVGDLEAHAWVECDGKVVLGGTHVDLSRFTVLQPVEET